MKEFRIRTELIDAFLRSEAITKEELCKRCKVTIKAFDKIMQNDKSVNLLNIYKIARIMDLAISQMFE